MKGIFYGVGVGPGDPELLTLKAVRVLRSCPVIAAPQTGGEKALALAIAAQAVDLSGKTILPLPFAMSRDPALRAESHRAAAAAVAAHLAASRDVAMLNLGDPSVFGTVGYVQQLLEQQGWQCRTVPGVTSFCAVAAELNTSLTSRDLPLHIIPAGGFGVEQALALPGTKVLMKAGSALPRVVQALRDAGLAETSMMVRNCGLPDQKICRSMTRADETDTGYFATIVVKEKTE